MTKEKEKVAHTPGPWLIADDGLFVYALHHYGWSKGAPCMVNRFSARVDALTHQGGTVEEAKANAHLIAASPDLLAALKELLEDPDYQIAIGGNPHAVDAMLSRARAALAKAEGK